MGAMGRHLERGKLCLSFDREGGLLASTADDTDQFAGGEPEQRPGSKEQHVSETIKKSVSKKLR